LSVPGEGEEVAVLEALSSGWLAVDAPRRVDHLIT
jgi:hypothetical protein